MAVFADADGVKFEVLARSGFNSGKADCFSGRVYLVAQSLACTFLLALYRYTQGKFFVEGIQLRGKTESNEGWSTPMLC